MQLRGGAGAPDFFFLQVGDFCWHTCIKYPGSSCGSIMEGAAELNTQHPLALQLRCEPGVVMRMQCATSEPRVVVRLQCAARSTISCTSEEGGVKGGMKPKLWVVMASPCPNRSCQRNWVPPMMIWRVVEGRGRLR